MITKAAKIAIETLDLENIIREEHTKNVAQMIEISQNMQKNKVTKEDVRLSNEAQNLSQERIR